jgi:hypothetical protein
VDADKKTNAPLIKDKIILIVSKALPKRYLRRYKYNHFSYAN